MDRVQTQLSQVDAKAMRRRVATIGCAAMAAERDQRVVRASLVLVADTETIAQLVRRGRLKGAMERVGSQVVIRQLDTATIAMMGPVQQVARDHRMAAQIATVAAAETKVAAMERHGAAVQAVQVALAAVAVVQRVVGALVPTREVDAGANTRRLVLKRRPSVALLK